MRNNHLSLRSGNPTLSSKTFIGSFGTVDDVMTIDGTVNRTIICLCILLTSGTLTFVFEIIAFAIIGTLIGLVLLFATIFKPHWAPKTVPLYALFQGAALGGISFMFNQIYDGIVTQAIVLTVGIFFSLFPYYFLSGNLCFFKPILTFIFIF